MKVVICGSRDCEKLALIEKAVKESGFEITCVISGDARGADKLADLWAKNNKIDRVIMPANWEGRGKSAGIFRNLRMIEYADGVIAIWDGKSRGTKNSIETAKNLGKKLHIEVYK